MRRFRMYLEQMNEIRRDEWLMSLNIATNPHLKAEEQRKLWQKLKPPPKPSATPEVDRAVGKAMVEERLKRKRGKGGV